MPPPPRSLGSRRGARREVPIRPAGSDEPGAAFRAALLPASLVVIALAVVSVPFVSPAFVTLPLVALLVVAFPILRRRDFSFVEPWTLIFVSVLFGVTLRGIYIAMRWPNAQDVERVFLRNFTPEDFIWPTVLLVVGLAALTLGYPIRSGGKLRRLPAFLRAERWDRRRLHALVVVCVLISLASFLAFATASGGFDTDRISAKRVKISSFDVEADWKPVGHLEFANELGLVAFLLLLGHYAYDRVRLTPGRLLLLSGLFVNAVALAFYTSARRGVALTGIAAIAVWLVAGRKISVRALVAGVLFVLVGFQVMTTFRSSVESSLADIPRAVAPQRLLDPLVLNLNFLGIAKTTHIINAIPEELPYRYGATFFEEITSPIPRAVWKDKPIVGLGREIGRQVYGTNAGVPPGLVAEAYWNFAAPGVVVIPFILGFLFRRMWESFRPHLRRRNMALIYVMVVMPFGFNVVGSGVSSAFVRAAIPLVIVMSAVWFITPHRVTFRRPTALAARSRR